jgi:hypothetical protein
MDGTKLTKESFLEDVKDHKLTIIKDDGLYRHIRLKNPEDCNQYFEIITWPGHLAYTGDMGDYLFSRSEDMFCFFRSEKGDLEINTGYWAEKVKAESIFGNGIREFSVEEFRERIEEYVRDYLELEEGFPIPEYMEEEIYSLMKAEDEWECVQAMRYFNSDKISFDDFWENSCQRKTLHFVWCCYAIVWGIAQYDIEKSLSKEQV